MKQSAPWRLVLAATDTALAPRGGYVGMLVCVGVYIPVGD